MKKVNLRLVLFAVVFIMFSLGFHTNSQANSIEKISMDIYLDDSGNATVTEIWNCSVDTGTEVYHPYYNLGNSKITDISVYEDNEPYITLSSWNTSGSLSSKAYKCGINKISNGVELCWGMSYYGLHTYKVKYKISNFVSELADSQMIYWTLIPYEFSNTIGNVNIKIHSNSYISDSIDVWGYGNYGGLAYVNNGAIYMSSEGMLKTNEYMTILVKFPLGTFNTANKLNKDFNYYYDMSQKGAKKYKGEINASVIFDGIIVIIQELRFIIICMVVLIFIRKIPDTSDRLKFKTKKDRLLKNIEYYRDIPCDGNLYRAYYVAFSYRIIKNKTDLLGAIILKWLKEGIVAIDKIERGFFRKRLDTAVIMNVANIDKIQDFNEKELFNMMYEASKDGILEKKEFEKWCAGKYTKILNWFDTVLLRTKNELISEGLVIKEDENPKKLFSLTKFYPTEQLKEYAIQIAGLKKYLLDYTLINDREAIEVSLFEDYLIYAQLMGIAKKVSKEFKDLYPDLIEQSHFETYDDIIFIHNCSASGISSANSARTAAESYSGGGGGFSSGGRRRRFFRWWRRPEEVFVKYNKSILSY